MNQMPGTVLVALDPKEGIKITLCPQGTRIVVGEYTTTTTSS